MSRSSARPSAIASSHELVVAVGLLGVLPLGVVVRALGSFRLAEEVGFVLGEEVELAPDQVAEAVAAEAQRSSS